MKKRKPYYGPVTDVPHHPPMESPAELLEAAKPGPILTDKQYAKKANDRAARFDWGFKGTHVLPADYEKKTGRKVLEPPTWRKVGIERTGDTYRLTTLVCRVAITPTTLRFAEVDPGTQTAGLTLQAALATGEIVERALVLKARKKT